MIKQSNALHVIQRLDSSYGKAKHKRTLSSGSWPSALSASAVAAAGNRLLGGHCDEKGRVFWAEMRPADGGRYVVVQQGDSGPVDLTPRHMSARSRLHEYGGAAFCVYDDRLWFCNDADQRLYVQAMGNEQVEPLTPEGVRIANLCVDRHRHRLLVIFEDHRAAGEAVNGVAAIPFGGGFEVLWQHSNFVDGLALSSCGKQLAFIAWDHPNMPWDNTRLVLAEFDQAGKLVNERHIGQQEALCQPRFSDTGALYVVSDRHNWWNLFKVEAGELISVYEDDAEYATPGWQPGNADYCLIDSQRALVSRNRNGLQSLAIIDLRNGQATPLSLPYVGFSGLVSDTQGGVIAVAERHNDLPELIEIDPDQAFANRLHRPAASPLPRDAVAPTQVLRFESKSGRQAHAFYHAPHHPDFELPSDEQPPLLVMLHGGPTAQASAALSLATQFWTSRGIAVVNVNYAGSTGYGRRYRQSLYGEWGVLDVEDAVMAAERLAEAGLADPERLLIRGGSAGGYTVLAALAFSDTFAAGANYYGVSDVMALAQETHKFESRYLDQLMGPLPQAEAVYQQRSPINHLDSFTSPLITFQGLEDKVVPPNQSEAIFQALLDKGVATAYVTFAGEQHGFRRAENQIRALEAELYFYGQVLGFTPADLIEPVEIHNL